MNRSCLFALVALQPAVAFAQALAVTDRGLVPGDSAVAIATSSQQEHAAARGGDATLVVWSDYRAQSVGGSAAQSMADVFGIRIDAAGNPIDAAPFPIAVGAGNQFRPRVAWNGENWLVLYESQDPSTGYYAYNLRAVRVSPSGAVLDTTPLLFPPTQFEPSTIGLQLAGQNGQWLVTRCIYHADGYGTYLAGQRINAAGTLVDTAPHVLLDWIYGSCTLLASGGEYLVAGPDWSNSATFKARRVGLDGVAIGPAFSVPSTTIAASSSEYYVSWTADYINLVGSRMTRAGTLLTPSGTMIVPGLAQYTHSNLAHDGTQWWFEWGAADTLRTVRISNAGTVLDPGGGVQLPITIGGNINTAYGPMLVPRTGGVQFLWQDSRVALGYDTNVFAMPVSAANVPGTERAISTGTRNQRHPDVSQGPGGTIAVVYVSEAANDDRVLLQFFDAAGTPTHAQPLEVAQAPTIGRPTIAWNGSLFAIAWDQGSGQSVTGIYTRRYTASGVAIDAQAVSVMPGFSPDIEALGDDFLIASSRVATYPQTIFAQSVRLDGPTGSLLDAAPKVLGGGYVSAGPRVRSDGTRWIVVYHSHWSHNDSRSDAIYNFVNTDGTFTVGLNPATTSGGSGDPDVAFSGSTYLFVWRSNTLSNANNDITARVMNLDGTFRTGNFTISAATGRQLRPVVGFDGTDFVVAWDDQRNQTSFFDERTDIYATRVSASGTLRDANGFAVVSTPHGDAGAALLSLPSGVSYLAASRFVMQQPFDSYRVGLSMLGAPRCGADFNADGFVDFSDFDAFVACFEGSGCVAADFNADGFIDFTDFDAFVSAFEQGC
ncbi:MAG: hypothetical protein SFY96_03075 [Planctomycetota bacterium]|nr:hypothetical protein [Planctomycetota bacterium]